jgi:hypothetical protein
MITRHFEIIGEDIFPLITQGAVLINLGFGNTGIGVRIPYRAYPIEPVRIGESKKCAQAA